jgi:two-component system response regulator AtoC
MIRPRIAVVDDDDRVRDLFRVLIERWGFKADTYPSGEEFIENFDPGTPQVILLDFRFTTGELQGDDILRQTLEIDPEAVVIMISAHANIETAIETMYQGAHYFLPKPVSNEMLRYWVQRAARDVEDKVIRYSGEGPGRGDHERLLESENPRMRKLLADSRKVARSGNTVLLTGENGTGKEEIARLIHESSPRSDMPLVTINCGAIPENLLESELFGHRRGSFTGAVRDKPGQVEAAHKGTLLLDEIGEMPLHLQPKILRLLENQEFQPVGGSGPKKADIRLIASTNRDLKAMVEAREFREDLFFRLSVIPLEVPPLRERKEDIMPLAWLFIHRLNRERREPVTSISPEARRMMEEYPWPGNVRELRNVIERIMIMEARDKILPSHLPLELNPSRALRVREGAEGEGGTWVTLEENEKNYIIEVLEDCDFNKTRAAEILGVDRKTLTRKLQRWFPEGIERNS